MQLYVGNSNHVTHNNCSYNTRRDGPQCTYNDPHEVPRQEHSNGTISIRRRRPNTAWDDANGRYSSLPHTPKSDAISSR